jgi:type IV secretion system protein VirB9
MMKLTKRLAVPALVAVLPLSGSTTVLAASRQPGLVLAAASPAAPAGASPAGARRARASGHARSTSRRSSAAPAARVEAANRASTRQPSRQGYVNAAQVYSWAEGALYTLYAAPERVSDIALQPGETLISVAAGDTARWVIGDTSSGSGSRRRTHILIKPSAAGLRTNLVIATDKRVYHVQLESTARTSMASISWTYPQDELLALGAQQAAAPVAEGLSVEALNFGYRIKGDEPAWRPVRAFDDGRQVFIEFPAGLAASEAPPLFVLGASGKAELVNYRLRGRYYVVDRLFDAAELRLGARKQQVVRIVRAVTGRLDRRGKKTS